MRYWMSVLVLLVSVGTVNAELYVAGQAGVAFPGNLTNVDWSIAGVSGSFRDNKFSQDTSALYGGKIGYYFDKAKWLGIETDIYRSTPNLTTQSSQVIGTFSSDHSLVTWSPIVLLVRLPSGSLPVPIEPYAGVGLGVFFSTLSSPGFSSSSTDVGFTSQVGLRYRVTQNIAVFGEWKYNRTSLTHDNLFGSVLNVQADYSAHLMSFGVGYHF